MVCEGFRRETFPCDQLFGSIGRRVCTHLLFDRISARIVKTSVRSFKRRTIPNIFVRLSHKQRPLQKSHTFLWSSMWCHMCLLWELHSFASHRMRYNIYSSSFTSMTLSLTHWLHGWALRAAHVCLERYQIMLYTRPGKAHRLQGV